MVKPLIHRLIAVLNMPPTVAEEIKYGDLVLASVTGNAFFTPPPPEVAALGAALTKYNTTATAAKARTKGTIEARGVARTEFIAALHDLRGIVQHVADSNPEQADAIITSASMSVKKMPVHKPRVFEATQGPVTGQVKLVTKSAGPRAAYDWQYSVDGGKTWIDVDSTLKSTTVIHGLPAAVTAMFRFRTLTKAGKSDWSVPTSLLVK
jgi:hypothetical protein